MRDKRNAFPDNGITTLYVGCAKGQEESEVRCLLHLWFIV